MRIRFLLSHSRAFFAGRRAVYSFCVLLQALVSSPVSNAADWTQWRGPSRSGISDETDWSPHWPGSGPRIVWHANAGTGFSSLVVAGNRLYTLGNSMDMDCIWCLDTDTGTVKWQHTYAADLDDRFFEGGPTSTPTIDGDRLYVLSRQGLLLCLDKHAGRVLWSCNIATETGASIPGWGFAGSPVVHQDLLILNVGSSGAAVDKMMGKVAWKSSPGEAGYMTPLPIAFEGRQLGIFASGKAYSAVDLRTGQVLWQYRWLTTYGCNAADPIFDRGELFISSGYNRGSALLKMSTDKPAVVWSSKAFQNQMASSVLVEGYLYGVDGNDSGERSLKCVEFSSGKIIWSEPGLGSATLIAADRRLIILSEQGELLVAPASNQGFTAIAKAKILEGKCWTVPVLSNGRIYCRNVAGEIVCVDVKNKNKNLP